MEQTPRKLAEAVNFALGHHPVVFVNGPRQAGKSTLVLKLSESSFPAEYITFDNVTQMAAAAASPETFLTARPGPLIIDEVQLVPNLFRPLKIVVDELRFNDKSKSNGRFLLTGSTNIMALPKLSDPLVGRMSVKTLYPFSASEALQTSSTFLEHLFAGSLSKLKINKTPLNDAIRLATFPEISGKQSRERTEWFDSYITTILQRDVRMLAEIEKIAVLPNLLRTLATRAGKLMNDAEIARDVGLNAVTGKSYRGILQAMFLTFDIRPWYRNIGKRLVKSRKGYLTDTLLLCHLLDWNLEDLRLNQPQLFGHVVENFVATELLKQLSYSRIKADLMHFRTSDNKEVDFILERPDGSLAAIEVKSSDTVSSSDFKGLRELQSHVPDHFITGIVLYSGNSIIPFGDRLFAVPLAALWS